MIKSVVVIGASGHGKVIADIIISSGDRVVGFLDDDPSAADVGSIRVLGRICDYGKYRDYEMIVAIGNSSIRQKLTERFEGVRWYTAVHPSAVISKIGVQIGEGSAVMANAVVNPCAVIGKHTIINTSAVVEHDNRIGDFSHISVGTHLGGTVTIGDHTWVGIGTSVKNNVSICSGCTIGAGTVVVRDIKESGTYVGTPARKVK